MLEQIIEKRIEYLMDVENKLLETEGYIKIVLEETKEKINSELKLWHNLGTLCDKRKILMK